MSSKPTIIFDTSVLNKFVKEKDSTPVFCGVLSGYTVRITAMTVEEFAATPEVELRRSLFQMCRRLLAAGYATIIEQPTRILELLIQLNAKNGSAFDWIQVPVRSENLEKDVYNDALIEDEELAKQQRMEILSTQKALEKIYERQRGEIEDMIKKGFDKRPGSFKEHLALIQMPGGAFWRFVGEYYESDSKNVPDEATLRQFLNACPPFRAFFLALALKWYDKCIRPLQLPSTFKIKRNDLMFAVYLPYCDQFITADQGQRDSLSQVAQAANLPLQIRSYSDFAGAFGLMSYD